MVQTYVWNPSLQNGTSVAKKNSIGCNNSASNSSSMSGDVTTIRMDEGLLQNTTYNKSLLNNRECVEVMPSIFSSATIFPANDSKNHQSWLHSSKISLRQFPIVSSNSLQSCFQAPFVLQPSLFVPSNNWLLQPVNISGKLFFEPVGSFSIVQSINNPVQLSNASTIPTEVPIFDEINYLSIFTIFYHYYYIILYNFFSTKISVKLFKKFWEVILGKIAF